MLIQVASRHLTDTLLANNPGQQVITGGVICFSTEPKTQNMYVLLGRETCFENMESRDGKWCDFGGKINPHESAVSGAAREFSEESLCVVQLSNKKNYYDNYISYVKTMLQEENYYMKISIIHTDQHVRVYYLKEIPWQPDIEQKFAYTRDRLLSVHKGTIPLPFSLRRHPALKDNTVDLHFLEKHTIAWWSVERLAEVIKNQGRFRRQRFRKTFLPILRLVVQKLQNFNS
jgi:hypothetical protein